MFDNCLISLCGNRDCYRFFGDECVVYHQSTGNTHLIEGTGVEIFKSLAREAATPRQLLQNLYNFFDFPNDFDVEVFLHQLILEYQTLGLLNITESCDA